MNKLILRFVNPNIATVTFIVNDTVYQIVKVKKNETVAKPAGDYTWYLGDTEYDFTTPVTENITLTAKFEMTQKELEEALANGTTTFNGITFPEFMNNIDLHGHGDLTFRKCQFDYSSFMFIALEEDGITLNEVIKSVKFEDCTFSCRDNGGMYGMFLYCINLENVEFINCNTSNVNTMSDMFMYCLHLKSLDLSGLDTSNVRYMSEMFYALSFSTEPLSLDLSNFDTSNLINAISMFHYANLNILNLSSFNTSKLLSRTSMFANITVSTIILNENIDASKNGEVIIKCTDDGLIYTGLKYSEKNEHTYTIIKQRAIRRIPELNHEIEILHTSNADLRLLCKKNSL